MCCSRVVALTTFRMRPTERGLASTIKPRMVVLDAPSVARRRENDDEREGRDKRKKVLRGDAAVSLGSVYVLRLGKG